MFYFFFDVFPLDFLILRIQKEMDDVSAFFGSSSVLMMIYISVTKSNE